MDTGQWTGQQGERGGGSFRQGARRNQVQPIQTRGFFSLESSVEVVFGESHENLVNGSNDNVVFWWVEGTDEEKKEVDLGGGGGVKA